MWLSVRVGLALSVPLLAGLAVLHLSRPTDEPAPTPGPADVEGRVTAPGGAAAGARVRLKGTAVTAQTDAEGRFRLPGGTSAPRVTAWKEGFFIGGTRLTAAPLEVRLARLPDEDNAEYEWVDPAPRPGDAHACANCHADIYREWSQSGHARSASGKHFRNLYEGTDWHGKAGVGWGVVTQYADGLGVCATCHAPTATSYDLRKLTGVAARGVHCDYCHKVADVADGEIGLTHGRFNLRLLRPAEGQLFFGALDDVDRNEDVYSPLYRDSRYCASCHEGIVFGVHVYSTYSEWQASPARREGKQCQDCHMKPTGQMSNMAPGHGGIERDPHTLANHLFFDESREATLRRAVKASVDLRREAGLVRARVRLWTEGAGHRVPTGFIDRHLLLVVEAQGRDGRPVPLITGPKLPALAGPELEGRPGRLYARVLRDPEGRSPAPFWLAAPETPPDTRLVPGRVDEATFTFAADLDRLRLRLRVLYRRFWHEVVRTKGWPDADVVVLEQAVSCPPGGG
jgi:hypothetical protein